MAGTQVQGKVKGDVFLRYRAKRVQTKNLRQHLKNMMGGVPPGATLY